MNLNKAILLSMCIWSLFGHTEEIKTLLQVPIPRAIEHYGYFLGNKAIVEKTSELEGTLTLSLPPELVGEGQLPQVFHIKLSDAVMTLKSETGSGNCLGEWTRANCDLSWTVPIGNLEQAKVYIEKQYQEKYPEAIEPLKQVAEKFNKSPYMLMRFIN